MTTSELVKRLRSSIFSITFSHDPTLTCQVPCTPEQLAAADRLEELEEEVARLREALNSVDRHLTNMQPHLASVKENFGELAVAFIDPHVDCAIEAARAALKGET